MKNELTEFWGQTICAYTRKEAIEDGVLCDISKLAKEAGFKYPVAISTGVYELIEAAVKRVGIDFNGIVWDILTILKFSIKNSTGSRCDFKVLITNKHDENELISMYSLCGPGDTAEPVITIMLPNED